MNFVMDMLHFNSKNKEDPVFAQILSGFTERWPTNLNLGNPVSFGNL